MSIGSEGEPHQGEIPQVLHTVKLQLYQAIGIGFYIHATLVFPFTAVGGEANVINR